MLINILVVIYWILNIYIYYLVGVIILSWIPGIEETKFYQIIRKGTDWYLNRFRGILVIGIIDLTPIIGFLLLEGALWGISYLIGIL